MYSLSLRSRTAHAKIRIFRISRHEKRGDVSVATTTIYFIRKSVSPARSW